MKFLIDHNLPARLKQNYHGSLHVTDVGLERSDDDVIWEFARDHGYMILTKDSDFQHLAARYGPPPKVLWLRVGNRRTTELSAILLSYQHDISSFESDPMAGLLILS